MTTERRTVRVDDVRWASYGAAAARAGFDRSAWIRSVLDAAASKSAGEAVRVEDAAQARDRVIAAVRGRGVCPHGRLAESCLDPACK